MTLPAKPPFDRLVADHGATILRVCRAVVGPTDADDAWSETFLAALRAYPDLDDGANHEAWLVTIAHRKAIDITRATARRAIPVAEVPEPRVAHHDSEAPDGLWSALRELSDRQRRALAYHHLAGLPFREVAAIIGGTEAAARRASADALAALRVKLTTPKEAAR